METVKILKLLLLGLIPLTMSAQHFRNQPFRNKYMMKMSTGLTAGVMVYHPLQDVYWNGNFTYNLENQIAVRGDLFIFVPDVYEEAQLDKNNGFFVGGEFHFPSNRFDMSLKLQPGLCFPYLKDVSANTKSQAEPAILGGMSFYYFILQNFHVFASTDYVYGTYYPEQIEPFRLDEIRLTLGLGVNIFVNHTPLHQRKVVKF